MAMGITTMLTNDNCRWSMILPRDDWRFQGALSSQETLILSPSRIFLIVAIFLISIVVSSFVANRPLHIGSDADGYSV